MKRIAVLLFALVAPILLLCQDQLQFVGESIDFDLSPDLFSINGVFLLVNAASTAKENYLYFPFAQGADSVLVTRVYNLNYGRSIAYKHENNGIRFGIRVEPNDTLFINISYTQKAARVNEYILTTTHSWGQALQWAEYSLTVDPSILVDSISYEPDRVDGNTYYWSRSDFFPEEDFRVVVQKIKNH